MTCALWVRDDLFGNSAASDPTSDFLAREKAILGDEFGASGSTSQSFDKDFQASASAFPDLDAPASGSGDDDGLDDDFVAAAAAPTVAPVVKGPYEGGLGSTGSQPHVSITGHDDLAAFENEYPAVEIESAAPAPRAAPATAQVSLSDKEGVESSTRRKYSPTSAC